ncbi:MAG: redoxin domain-containing protein [Chitinophagales bacterium]|nr:redoxin domain-containing protein [Hyphomicrobiales bacterium]
MAARNTFAEQITPAPPWHVTKWFNTQTNLTLEALRGKVVAMFAFQMLCPGCVSASIPQAKELATIFKPDEVAMIGFHTVFEHHAAMTPESLEAFLHEYRVGFPVAVDAPGERGSPLPKTMAAYDMQGTPPLVLIDAQSRRRLQSFGHVPGLQLGASIAWLLRERNSADTIPKEHTDPANADVAKGVCADGICAAKPYDTTEESPQP